MARSDLYSKALWDDSDPLYAPGLNRSGNRVWWKPTASARRKGWSIKTAPLSGTPEQIAARCRELTRDMVRFTTEADRRIEPNTWNWLFVRYLSDEFSPYQDVKGNTAVDYRGRIDYWRPIIGESTLDDMDFPTLKKLQKAMQTKGRSKDFIAKKFTMMRLALNYGVQIECADALRLSTILSKMRIEKARPRNTIATREQVLKIVAAADAAGDRTFAALVMMEFELAIRRGDLVGIWLSTRGTGGITRGQKRWQDGLTWDMFAPDLSAFAKVISKTQKSNPMPATFDLTGLPDLRARLAGIAPQDRLGPVFVGADGLPLPTEKPGALWRKYAKAAGVDPAVQMRDMRAGAITEARQMGATPFEMRALARHADITTTNRYARGDDEATTRVIDIRQRGSNRERD